MGKLSTDQIGVNRSVQIISSQGTNEIVVYRVEKRHPVQRMERPILPARAEGVQSRGTGSPDGTHTCFGKMCLDQDQLQATSSLL